MTGLSLPGVGKEELWQLKLLAKGQTEWEDLDYEDKRRLYKTGVDLSYKVSNEQIRDFELKMALRGEMGISAIGKAAAELAKKKAIQ